MEISKIQALLEKTVPGALLEVQLFGRSQWPSVWIEMATIHQVALALKNADSGRLDWLEALTAVQVDDAIVVNYFIRSTVGPEFIVLRGSLVPRDDHSEVLTTSVSDIWPMAASYEREVSDLFGVSFLGLPRLSPERSIVTDDVVGFPLRKNFRFMEQKE